MVADRGDKESTKEEKLNSETRKDDLALSYHKKVGTCTGYNTGSRPWRIKRALENVICPKRMLSRFVIY